MPLFNQTIEASIKIDAPAQTVWDILVDLDNYGVWNPFTYEMESTLAVGDPVQMRVRMGEDNERDNVTIVSAVEPPYLLQWDATLVAPFLMSSRRWQTVEDLGDGRTRYTTRETFRGPLVPVVMLAAGDDVQRGFDAVCNGLKSRAEALT